MSAGLAARVGIVDYQAGNLQSIRNALTSLGAYVLCVREPGEVRGCTHLVLPGVGAFGFCADRLSASGLIPALEDSALGQGIPLLGICVGMQLLADGSEESPEVSGLGWLGGRVRLIPDSGPGIRVPHVGWNAVTFDRHWANFQPGTEADFYFDHSYAYTEPRRGVTVASCQHGISFSAVVQHDNIVAVQFHPEKSQTSGMRFLRGFLAAQCQPD
ncbi:MAG: imidazole glycerol phosphate synthase subunit HisH [Vicinamibacterales bacterium]